ncbi:glycerophosphodiester phosphodiesterase family protein [Chenggangzhangella methanolivorans]|uniref:glycerophosphodiester phosphodiesterase n=1 Tax=Chenggangzhangella methanolivorans TaxID=1437009 RepID=A0A9E6R6Z3_9HYPH|nr:glycerophosphodiester phosphodiesterase family protein [Chenggangzhangella methanolivorans]QZN98974.1 glycerophosphodiester phosphodiesterase [Chenggangzhangella methanolivorans]
MRKQIVTLGLALAVAASALAVADKAAAQEGAKGGKQQINVQLGPRPYFLINDMDNGPLKRKLQQCENKSLKPTEFSIGHRGAPLQFPEHTVESYEAAARMGAGVLECDVAFTKDLELVCRHAQNDLHTTTNILLTPLAKKCTNGFTPAEINDKGEVVTPASAECRTSDITLAEFKSLRGKMDAFNPRATTVEEFVDGTAKWRTDLYAGETSGHLMTHKESIELFKKLGVKMTPELKSPVVEMPFRGFSQQDYAQKLINEYKEAGVKAKDVFPQSFDINDVLYWVQKEPTFGRQAVYLDDANTVADLPNAAELQSYRDQGIRIWAPPVFAALAVNGKNEIVASKAAKNAKAAGLDLIIWSLERSGRLADLNGDFYYQTIERAVSREGDLMRVIDVLAQDVGARAIFSDWPAPVSYYANCMGLK